MIALGVAIVVGVAFPLGVVLSLTPLLWLAYGVGVAYPVCMSAYLGSDRQRRNQNPRDEFGRFVAR